MSQDAGEDRAGVTVSSGNGSNETTTTDSTIDTREEKTAHFQPLMRVKPQQSVISNAAASNRIKQKVKAGGSGKRREAARISDGDSASGDSGSSDEMGE